MDRPGLKTLIVDIEAGKVDVIVVYKIDRLTRSLTDFSKLVEVFDTHDVSFVSVTQAFNTTNSMGRPIDYVLLHIDESDLSGKDILTRWLDNLDQSVPLCIRDEEANYRDPIVVIGRLRSDSAKVYDHAYVWFPFQVSVKQFNILSADIGFGLESFVQSWFDKADWAREFNKRYKQFEEAYSSVNGGDKLEFRMTRRPVTVDRPYIGFDTDTVTGNSGSPIYSRVDNCLLGVFAGGLTNGAVFANSSWSRHEFGTPISAIIADLMQRGTGDEEISSDIANAREAILKKLSN